MKNDWLYDSIIRKIKNGNTAPGCEVNKEYIESKLRFYRFNSDEFKIIIKQLEAMGYIKRKGQRLFEVL